MNIRPLEKDDWVQFKTLRLEALREYPEAFGSSFEEESVMSDEELKASFKSCDVFGCFIENTLVGCAGFFVLSSLLKMRHRGVLCTIYTKPAFRKQGIADALVKTLIHHAKGRVEQLHLTVVTSNQMALKVYERNGFTVYGTEPRSLKIGNHFYDEHMMVLAF